MAIPATSVDVMFRNSMSDVSKFLEQRHAGQFMVFNLTENEYDGTLFSGQVRHLGWLDHHAPPLIRYIEVVTAMHDHLQKDPKNVVAVHCKAGRGRTGTAIAGYLLYSKHFNLPQDAMDFFNFRRSSTGRGIEGPGQMRAVEYIFEWMQDRLSTPLVFKPSTLLLKRVIMFPVPKLGLMRRCEPVVEVWMNAQQTDELGATWTNFGDIRQFTADSSAFMVTEVPNLALSGDVKIRVYNRSMLGKDLLFSLYFHTSLIPADESFFDLTLNELDGFAPTSSSFSPDFKIRLLFEQPFTAPTATQQ